jgi:hypothetical protein
MLHQALLTILAATAGIMAVLLLDTSGGPAVTETVASTSCSATTCWWSGRSWRSACWC